MMGLDLHRQKIDNNIRKAKLGDTYAAKELMREFVGAVKMYTGKATARHPEWEGKPMRTPDGKGIQMDDSLLRYFGECFGQILKVEETTQSKKGGKAMAVYDALHLKKDTVQADPNRKGKEMDIANEVSALLELGGHQIDAFGFVAGKYYPENQENYSLGSSTPVVYLAGRFYPEGGTESDKGLKATREAYYHYNIKSQAKRITKQLQQDQDQQ